MSTILLLSCLRLAFRMIRRLQTEVLRHQFGTILRSLVPCATLETVVSDGRLPLPTALCQVRNNRLLKEMSSCLDTERLATMVRTKRATRGLREVAAEIGDVSPSTLSRVENGRAPDMETFLLLCDWLKVPPAEFFSSDQTVQEEKSPAESIELQLRADKNLDPATANTLATIIRAAYQELSRNKSADQ